MPAENVRSAFGRLMWTSAPAAPASEEAAAPRPWLTPEASQREGLVEAQAATSVEVVSRSEPDGGCAASAHLWESSSSAERRGRRRDHPELRRGPQRLPLHHRTLDLPPPRARPTRP